MIGKLTLALLLTLPTIAVAIDLEGYYITAKGGVSKTSDTGTATYGQVGIIYPSLKNDDLGTGSAFGFSVGKYLTDSFRLELEAIKRTSYELDTYVLQSPTDVDTANIDTTSLFINSFKNITK